MLFLALAACGATTKREDPKMLDLTLDAYASAIRWTGLDATVRYMDPVKLKESPPAEMDLERLRQVEVGAYQVVSRVPDGEGKLRQIVNLDIVNKNTQRVRTVRVEQLWRWDGETKHWWLDSGLPDITAR